MGLRVDEIPELGLTRHKKERTYISRYYVSYLHYIYIYAYIHKYCSNTSNTWEYLPGKENGKPSLALRVD